MRRVCTGGRVQVTKVEPFCPSLHESADGGVSCVRSFTCTVYPSLANSVKDTVIFAMHTMRSKCEHVQGQGLEKGTVTFRKVKKGYSRQWF